MQVNMARSRTRFSKESAIRYRGFVDWHVFITQALKDRYPSFDDLERRSSQHDVNDRLGRKTGNCRAIDVLDTNAFISK